LSKAGRNQVDDPISKADIYQNLRSHFSRGTLVFRRWFL